MTYGPRDFFARPGDRQIWMQFVGRPLGMKVIVGSRAFPSFRRIWEFKLPSHPSARVPQLQTFSYLAKLRMRRGMRQLEPVTSPHVTLAIKDRSVAAPFGVNSQTNATKFSKTVTQKTERKDCFLDL